MNDFERDAIEHAKRRLAQIHFMKRCLRCLHTLLMRQMTGMPLAHNPGVRGLWRLGTAA